MIEVLKERKIGIIASVVATILDFTVLLFIANAIGFENNGMNVWIIGSIVLAVVAYLMAGGLNVAWNALIKSFQLGLMFPIIPINLAIGIMCATFVLIVIWFFPIVAVLINCFMVSR